MACTNDTSCNKACARPRGVLYSFFTTLLLWCYFLGAGIFFVLVFYLPAYVFSRNREHRFEQLNSRFFRGFLWLVRLFFPMHQWQIDEKMRRIKSSIVICNHVSYLDPLICIALFERQKTIVKPLFFSLPVFGWLVRVSGYLPATTRGRFSAMMIEQVEKMSDYLADGGILFVFPEGTRNQQGKLGSFQQGIFKIARLCQAPLVVVKIENSDKVFAPGNFLFSASSTESVRVRVVGSIRPDYTANPPTAATLEQMAVSMLAGTDAACPKNEQHF